MSRTASTTGGRRAWLSSRSGALKAGRLLASLAATLLGLLLITFLIGRVMPIDPVLAVVGERATNEVYMATSAANVSGRVKGTSPDNTKVTQSSCSAGNACITAWPVPSWGSCTTQATRSCRVAKA